MDFLQWCWGRLNAEWKMIHSAPSVFCGKHRCRHGTIASRALVCIFVEI